MTPTTNGYSLYIHIPWCVKKCPYCDFNSHEKRDDYNEEAYIQALIDDLTIEAKKVPNRPLQSIFIGGGTPSLFSVKSLDRLLTEINQQLTLSDNIEITLEANPGTAETAKFIGFREIGINRLSIGIQSFNDTHLKKLGRIHDSEQAHRAITLAQDAGFERINLDLMFGLPDQTTAQAIQDIEQALRYQTGHLSHYQLTLEKNTLFHKHPPKLPVDDQIWQMQVECQSLIDTQLTQYEVSAYAANQQQARHNVNYWQFGDYIGIGAGAYGKLTQSNGEIKRYWKKKLPREYMKTAGSAACIGSQNSVIEAEIPFEFMMNSLRLKSGFTLQQFTQRTHLNPAIIEPTLSTLINKQLLQLDNSTYRCTDQGWNFLNNTLEHFLPST